MRGGLLLLSVCCFLGGGCSADLTGAPVEAASDVLPRRVLFADAERRSPLLSPDGSRVSFVGVAAGAERIWVGPVEAPEQARPVTGDGQGQDGEKQQQRISEPRWAFTNQHVVYLQDRDGDENWHVHVVDLASRVDRDLTPGAGAQARIEGLSRKAPEEVLVGINDRDKRYHDLYRINLNTGARRLVWHNTSVTRFVVDDDLELRFALRPEPDGSTAVLERDGQSGLRMAFEIPFEDTLTTQILGFDATGKTAYLADSRGRDRAALVEMDLATKATKELVADPKADIRQVVLHPTSGRAQAALSAYDRRRWHVLDPSLALDLEAIGSSVKGGDIEILSRSNDDARWLVASIVSDAPRKYWLVDRTKHSLVYLFSQTAAFEGGKLAPMRHVLVKASDGLDLVSYLTLPRGIDDERPAAPLPMVLLVHGGPWSRDEWSFNVTHQWLADRGYAVLSVNFRGSLGFGKRHLNAGNGEWGGKMQEDLLDAVAWAVGARIADPSRVAIMGSSYGGYATLAGLTSTPKTFACGVDTVGPSSLVTLLEALPTYWAGELEQTVKRIGDHRTSQGRALLEARSPLEKIDRVERPLLVGQGANDPRVNRAESEQIVHAMEAKGLPVTYVFYPDEGHGFARPENRSSFNAVTEVFLARCLGGRAEALDLAGSSITVPVGAQHIPSLAALLR